MPSSIWPEAYIATELILFPEPKARQMWQGSYEAEGHITRKISADIQGCEVYIVLILALTFIIIVGR